MASSFRKAPTPDQTRTGLRPRVYLLLPQAPVLPKSDAGSDGVNQHQVSSSKTVRPLAPYGARCMGHTIRTWSVVCSEAPHAQFGEGARPHLCMDQ